MELALNIFYICITFFLCSIAYRVRKSFYTLMVVLVNALESLTTLKLMKMLENQNI